MGSSTPKKQYPIVKFVVDISMIKGISTTTIERERERGGGDAEEREKEIERENGERKS